MAILVLLSLGRVVKVVELLYGMRHFDTASLFIEATKEFGLLDDSVETSILYLCVFICLSTLCTYHILLLLILLLLLLLYHNLYSAHIHA